MDSGKAFAVALVIGIGAIWVLDSGPSTPSPSAAKSGSAYDACYMAQKFVSDRLKAPATADYQTCRDAQISPKQDGYAGTQFSVFSHVDSQNGFGAKIRTSYLAVVQYKGYDASQKKYDWSLVTLTMDGQTWANPNFQSPAPAAAAPSSSQTLTRTGGSPSSQSADFDRILKNLGGGR